MKKMVLCSVLFLVMFIPGAAMDKSEVLSEIKNLEKRFGGHLGLMAKNLRTGEVVEYNARERFPTASVIKLPILVALFDQLDAKAIDPSLPVVLSDGDKKPGSGVLQYMTSGNSMTILDAARLMIILSDNTATNLVLDRLASTHDARMEAVNSTMLKHGLKDTRLLNRLYSWETKKTSGESVRYGIGVSTPADMVLLLELLHAKKLGAETSNQAMLEILKQQFYGAMIPRYIPSWECEYLSVAHKTGSVNETKVDVGLILSDKAEIAIAIFVDKHPDHEETDENLGMQLGAHVARAVWNYWTGSSTTGDTERRVDASHVDWNFFPGGKWGIWRSPAAPFPHPDRSGGFTHKDGTTYPFWPHYTDSSVTVFVPEGFHETAEGANLIVHFHGHNNDNMGVLEKFMMPQSMVQAGTNAILVLAQGPYRARDSFGGKMEDEGGLKRLVDDVLMTMRNEEVTKSTNLARLILSAHSGGYRPTAYALDRGGMISFITHVFLFDAFYGNHDQFRTWLLQGKGKLFGAYTNHLSKEHQEFEKSLTEDTARRLFFAPTQVSHNDVVNEFFGNWLEQLDPHWKRQNTK